MDQDPGAGRTSSFGREKLNRLPPSDLIRFAAARGIEPSYIDMSGRRQFASSESLRLVLKSLGIPRNRKVEPVRVVWDKKPFGYRQLGETLVISAPRKSFQLNRKDWGLFMPLYALHSGRSSGAGDLSDLKDFGRWAGRRGASWVGTLPLLSLFLDRPFEPSPYSPISRLFWSEFWLDVGPIKGLPRSPWVDYRRQMRLKWKILEKRAARWSPPQSWLRSRPEAEEYARFRAGMEGKPDFRQSVRTHLYAVWLAERQMEDLRRSCARSGVGIYFDLPLGVHPQGYDAWKEREIFVEGMYVGAPPDAFFTKGQDWGFRPTHPEKIRQEGYSYFIRSVRHSMQYASMLRVDHIMGLHRLFWVPEGRPPREGVYVRYRAEEMTAILCLESHLNRCAIVGEDLGTVPYEVRRSMRRHGVAGMFVVQYEIRPDSRRPLRPAPRQSVAGLNTHDMPPFAAFWRGWKGKQSCLRWMRRRGFLPETEKPSASGVSAATLRVLAQGPAESVLVNVEDLWGEERPHNVPGTVGQKSWRRKARFPLKQWDQISEITRTLREISRCRLPPTRKHC